MFVLPSYRIQSIDAAARTKRSSQHQTAATDAYFERTASHFGRGLNRPQSQSHRYALSSARVSLAKEAEISQAQGSLPVRQNISSGIYRQRNPLGADPSAELKNLMFSDKIYKQEPFKLTRNGSLQDLKNYKFGKKTNLVEKEQVESSTTVGFKVEDMFRRTTASLQTQPPQNQKQSKDNHTDIYIKRLDFESSKISIRSHQ